MKKPIRYSVCNVYGIFRSFFLFFSTLLICMNSDGFAFIEGSKEVKSIENYMPLIC